MGNCQVQEVSDLILNYNFKTKMMKKNISTKIIISIFSLFTFFSCDNVDFGDVNTDPNKPSSAAPDALMVRALTQMRVDFLARQTAPILYVQHMSNSQYPDESRYSGAEENYAGLYSGILSNLKQIVDINTNDETKDGVTGAGSNGNQIAIATMLRVFALQKMTDKWGEIPYTESLDGINFPFPKFDKQETIYKGLFDELDFALSQIDSGNSPKGDILFNGNMDRWKKFGNTLKMVMALRLSKRYPASSDYPAVKFNEALSAGVIMTADENMYYNYLSDDNNNNPWYDQYTRDGRVDWLVSDRLVNYMVGSGDATNPEDPRLAKYAEPASSSSTYVGAPYGESNGSIPTYSLPSDNITTSQVFNTAIFFTAAQTNFSIAEASILGWVSNDAETHFNDGIMASNKQWGVDAAVAQTFIDGLTYSGIQSIAEQKWVSLYLQGYEAWAEWRRIGGPSTIIKPAILVNGTDIPQRRMYGTEVVDTNNENYEAAITSQGPDELSTKLWWAN